MAKQKDIPIKTIDCLAIRMTSTHCKGITYQLTEEEAIKGVELGYFKIIEVPKENNVE